MVDVIRGFRCDVSVAEVVKTERQPGIGVASRRDGGLVVAVHHPDIGTLAAFLSDKDCARFADLIAETTGERTGQVIAFPVRNDR